MIELLMSSSTPVDMTDEYVGEVSAASLITGPALASLAGLSAGINFNTGEGWLEFRSRGRRLFIAKKPFKYRVAWDSINTAGIARGKIVNINGTNYVCRLVRGAEANPSAWTVAMGQNDPPLLRDSEWIRLLARVHVDTPDRWANFTNADLGVGGTINGRISHNMETITSIPAANMAHGNTGILQMNYPNKIDGNNQGFDHYGWRPCLERA